MQKSMFQKIATTVIYILLFTVCLYYMKKVGIHPVWAVIVFLVIKGLFRFIGCLLRIVPVSLVIAILLFYFLSHI